ncbi:Antitoxin VapB [Candidatus Electrothrix aarhusensis]|jgi:virulence-associated protein VagC
MNTLNSDRSQLIDAINKLPLDVLPERDEDDWFDAPGVSNDFMEKRDQPDDQIRETL